MSRESNMDTIRAIFEADACKDVNGFVDRFYTNCVLQPEPEEKWDAL